MKKEILNKNIELLKSELKQIRYPEKLRYENALNGAPRTYFKILNYSLISYSRLVAEYLNENSFKVISNSEEDFIDMIYNALPKLFNYSPYQTIKKSQFFTMGYADEKALLCVEVIRLVKVKHYFLSKPNNRCVEKNIEIENKNKAENPTKPIITKEQKEQTTLQEKIKMEDKLEMENKRIENAKFNREDSSTHKLNSNHKFDDDKQLTKNIKVNKNTSNDLK